MAKGPHRNGFLDKDMDVSSPFVVYAPRHGLPAMTLVRYTHGRADNVGPTDIVR